jgi:serine/threonine-protein kinase
MNLDAATWSRITDLFERLADLPADQRRAELERIGPDPVVTEWLQRLLDAHDRPEDLLIDHTLDQLTARLAGDERMPVDWRGVRFGNWQAVEEISRGGMATVMRGERADGAYEQEVAIKVLQPGSLSLTGRQQLAGELRVLARLEHPGIVRLLDGGFSDDGWPFLVMEYVRGQPIDEWCRDRRADLATRIALLRQVADAVAWAHARLIVHADLKPSNVLVDAEGRVRVVDFGIASRLARDPGDEPHPLGRALRCSPAYASPEQLRGEPANVASDVYGLGAILYELLAARRLRDGGDVTRLLVGADCELEVPDPSAAPHPGVPARSLTGDLDAVCRRALAIDPADRYASMTALADDLERWRNHRPVSARPATPMLRLRKWLRRQWLPVSAAALASAALLTGAAMAVWQAQRAETALAGSQAALARAEHLNRFIVELFRAAAPTRPPDELPTTEELLALGAQRALDASVAPATDRLGMLLTISEIELSRSRFDQAQPLLDEALAIARRSKQTPDLLIDALTQRARLHLLRRETEQADRALSEAMGVVAQEPVSAETDSALQGMVGMLKLMRGELDEAVDLLESQRLRLDGVDNPRRQYNILSPLANALSIRGDTERALALQHQIRELVETLHGSNSYRYAMAEANMAISEGNLGHFESSIPRLTRALDLYDRVFDEPVVRSAAARHVLARNLFYDGRSEQAIAEMDRSSHDWALASGTTPAEYVFLPLNRAMIRLRDPSEPRTLQDVNAAIDRMESGSAFNNPEVRVYAEAVRALYLCRTGDRSVSRTALDRLDTFAETVALQTLEYRVHLHEARAQCLLRTGSLDEARKEADQAMALELPPGRIPQWADLWRLSAEIEAAAGRPAAARATLEEGVSQLDAVARSEHPALQRLRSAMQSETAIMQTAPGLSADLHGRHGRL